MSGSSRLLGGISTNYFLSISIVTVPTWHVECVSSEHYCQLEFSVHDICKILEPLQSLQEQPTWLWWSSLMNALPPEMMIITGHDTDIYIEWVSLSEPHTSMTSLCLWVCMFARLLACLDWPLTCTIRTGGSDVYLLHMHNSCANAFAVCCLWWWHLRCIHIFQYRNQEYW